MQSKISLTGSVCIISIVGIIFSLLIFFALINDQNVYIFARTTVGESLKSTEFPKQIKSGFFVRLKIPEIGVDAVVESVGLTSTGAMDTPKGPSAVAWFSSGPRPGEIGSAVIDGHFNQKTGAPGVFYKLEKLQKGEEIFFEDGKGETIVFTVQAVRSYGGKEQTSDVFTSSDDKAHLNLITCDGVWDRIKKSYSQRLVVFTDKKVQ